MSHNQFLINSFRRELSGILEGQLKGVVSLYSDHIYIKFSNELISLFIYTLQEMYVHMNNFQIERKAFV